MVGIQTVKMRSSIFAAPRARGDEIPHKSPALPDFYTTARAVAARPPLPCKGEGVIRKSFLGNFSGI